MGRLEGARPGLGMGVCGLDNERHGVDIQKVGGMQRTSKVTWAHVGHPLQCHYSRGGLFHWVGLGSARTRRDAKSGLFGPRSLHPYFRLVAMMLQLRP